MAQKVLVVGGVAGGASAAARLRRLDENAEIIMFERGPEVSFSNCCLPYYLGGDIASADALVMMTPASLNARFNIDVRVKSEVTGIDREKKEVRVRKTDTGEEYTESYDKLVLSPGAKAIMPKSIKGLDHAGVFNVKNVDDVRGITAYIAAHDVKKAVIAGGGFIGVEVAENLKKSGLSVAIVEGADQILSNFDHDMVQTLHKALLDNGVELYLNTMLTEVGDGFVRGTRKTAAASAAQGAAGTASANGAEADTVQEIEIPADMVIMSIGVAPETTLAREAGLEIGKTGGVKVNANFQTSDPDIYAVGDVIETFNSMTGDAGRLALAGPAQRQARAAADHICGIDSPDKGFIGSSCIKVFEMNAASTGLNEKQLKEAGISYDYSYILSNDKVSLMPESRMIYFKLLFEVPTGRILGAQAIGLGDVTKRIDVVATLITMHGTLEDLKDMELCYSPVYGTAKDITNVAALVGLNLLSGRVHQVHVEDARALVESGAFIVDVREPGEYAAGHLNNAVNIPLGQIRARISEIPKDRPVYLHCRSSQRSYYALCELLGHGYTNVYNMSGSFLGISLYEYFEDVTTGRKPILDHYNFK